MSWVKETSHEMRCGWGMMTSIETKQRQRCARFDCRQLDTPLNGRWQSCWLNYTHDMKRNANTSRTRSSPNRSKCWLTDIGYIMHIIIFPFTKLEKYKKKASIWWISDRQFICDKRLMSPINVSSTLSRLCGQINSPWIGHLSLSLSRAQEKREEKSFSDWMREEKDNARVKRGNLLSYQHINDRTYRSLGWLRSLGSRMAGNKWFCA